MSRDRVSLSSSSRIPVFGATQLPSSLGKRGAGEAGLGDDIGSSGRRMSSSSTTAGMSLTSLQRRVLSLEAREREQAQEIEEQRLEIERLKSERQVLFEGENDARQEGDQRVQELQADRTKLTKANGELRKSRDKLDDDYQRLRSEYNHLSTQHSTLSLNSKAEVDSLTSRVKELEAERDRLKGWERRAKGLSIDLEEEKRRADEGRRQGEEERVERGVEDVVRKELRRQAQHLVTLERNHAALQNEVLDLRQKRKDAEAAERASKDVERSLRDEIRTLQEQLERARRDMDSLTQTFPSSSPSSPTADISTLQTRLSTLSALHTQATKDLAERDAENRSLHSRLAQLSQESASSIVALKKQADEAERELRWAKEGRASAERREALARREVEALRTGERPMPGGGSFAGGDQSARVKQLEGLVETYKAELEGIQRDSRDVEERLTAGAGLVKKSQLEETEAKVEQLEKDIEALEATLAQLTSANTTLDAEVNDLMRRVASGEYNPEKERCLEMRDNPASRIASVRNAQLEELRRENEALLDRLGRVERDKNGGSAPSDPDSTAGLVPRESWDRLVKEKEALEVSHAKRLLRLKEIFGNKSKEFLEAVYSLLGWRIKFDESGADIRLTSMYAPKGKNGLTLKFASQEGHFGTMQMTGMMARGLEESRHFWIVERQSVPGFLAQVTTEMFEKTTIGRAAGYVGLE